MIQYMRVNVLLGPIQGDTESCFKTFAPQEQAQGQQL